MINWSSFRPVGRESALLAEAFESGWISGGPFVERLEENLRAEFGCPDALSVANGTAALALAYQTLGLKPGDRVIVPAFCFQAAANVLLQLGAVPVFCDVDPLTWNQTAQSVRAAHGPGVVGVVVVHNYGYAAQIAEIAEWAREAGIWLIEDAAEAWFTEYDGRLVGTFGDVTTLSMHATKTIACGEGGVVLVNDEALSRRARLYRSHGLDRTTIQYLHLLDGNNYRLSNLLCAVAVGQLEGKDTILAEQAHRKDRYHALLSDLPEVRFQKPAGKAHDHVWASGLRLDLDALTIDRDGVIARMKDAGIDTRPGFYPPSALAYHDKDGMRETPTSDYLARSIIVLPCAADLDDDALERICSTFRAIIEGARRTPGAVCRPLDRADPAHRRALADFAAVLNADETGFRYFGTRTADIIDDQLYTMLLERDGETAGYGHLEQAGGVTWLGIAVARAHAGAGLGRRIMHDLLEAAAAKGVARVDLQVDRDNTAAQRLYHLMGFVEVEGASSADALRMVKEVV